MSSTERARRWVRALRASGGAVRRRGRVPRMIPPTRIEESYGAKLGAELGAAVRAVYTPDVMLALRAIVDGSARDRERLLRADAFDAATRARALLEMLAGQLRERVRQVDVERLARLAAQQTQAFNREQLSRQTRAALGVDVFSQDPTLPLVIDVFASANVALIDGLAVDVARDVERAVVSAVQNGDQWGTLATDLETRLGFPEKRARRVARDQVGKLYGQINAARQRELGVTRFRWRCVDDERVRGRPDGKYPNAKPSHWARHNKVYEYANPPDGQLPGEDYECRCGAEPIFDDILAGLDD